MTAAPMSVVDPEAAYVGALLHLPPAAALDAIRLITPEDFADPRMTLIITACRELAGRGLQPDPTVVLAHLRTHATVRGADALTSFALLLVDLYASVPVPASVRYYAAGLLDLSLRRRVTEMSTRLAQAADRDSTGSLTDLVRTEVAAVAAVHARLDTATAVTA
jgi:replicative DNA helicase